MTTVFPPSGVVSTDSPGTHALIIGVGGYPHLLGGDPQRLLDKPMGLSQLSSPPASAEALANWLLARQTDSHNAQGFDNPNAPLASVEMLISPPWGEEDSDQPYSYTLASDETITIDRAIRERISEGYTTWLGRVAAKPDNIGIFYFCGHGLTGMNDYVLPEDFGRERLNKWHDAIDISGTARAARRAVAGTLYFFIDACRENEREALNPGAGAQPLQQVDLEKPVQCFSRLMIWATGEGRPAHGEEGKPSRFTSALTQALSGFYGERTSEDGRWVVTGDALAKTVEQIVELENHSLDEHLHQHTEAQRIGSQPLTYFTEEPQTLGQTLSLVQVSPRVRDVLETTSSVAELPSLVKETIAEDVESGRIALEQIHQEVARWLKSLAEWIDRLTVEPDQEAARKLRALVNAGKQEEARTFYDSLLDPGIGLCLSGGGYRAMLFHLGSLWRLNEVGYLRKLERISSVSGGSITAAMLGAKWPSLGFDAQGVGQNFATEVVQPIRALAKRTIDVGSVISGLLLPGTIGDRITDSFHKHLYGDKTLQDLPDEPRFVICATNVQSGALWRFAKPYMRDYRVGEVLRPTTPLAVAVAASSASPPVLSPVELRLNDGDFTSGSGVDLQRPPFTTRILLCDGAVYDNLGLETVWKRYDTVLVSDAAGQLEPEDKPDNGWTRKSVRAMSLIDNVARSLRKRQLIDSYVKGVRKGCYWSINTDLRSFALETALPATLDRTRQLARIPARFQGLDGHVQEQLINWGYAVCDAALRKNFDAGLSPPPDFPYPGSGIG